MVPLRLTMFLTAETRKRLRNRTEGPVSGMKSREVLSWQSAKGEGHHAQCDQGGCEHASDGVTSRKNMVPRKAPMIIDISRIGAIRLTDASFMAKSADKCGARTRKKDRNPSRRVPSNSKQITWLFSDMPSYILTLPPGRIALRRAGLSLGAAAHQVIELHECAQGGSLWIVNAGTPESFLL